jgi:hypothetical protein
MYSTVLGFDEVIFVKDQVNLSDAQITDIMRNAVYLFNVTQGELMEPYMDVAADTVRQMDSEFILGIRESKRAEDRWISTVGQLAS